MVKNNIARLRRECEINQKELGEKLGVAQTTISAWETGKTEPDNESMNKMANIFMCSMGYLTGYETDDRYRGLSQEEWSKRMSALNFERDINEHLGQEEREEILIAEEAQKDWLYDEWAKSGASTYFEAFQINLACDHLNKAERQKILDMAKLMYPNAF